MRHRPETIDPDGPRQPARIGRALALAGLVMLCTVAAVAAVILAQAVFDPFSPQWISPP